jgi:alkanesulfonate monooxygenase SsuD/methylene tetrahydromethanopterin reductase-like flavin-dependent oxidoreductase (luciferase family)
MKLELGIWDHFERRPDTPVAQQYADKVRLVREAERLGFRHYHMAEHHLTPLDLGPSPAVFLAALAQATERIRIGTGVFCLPLYHPLRLLQELCMLDNIAGGRLDFGVGRGIRATEHEWFGVAQDEVQARFDEMLELLLGAMATGRVDFHGKYYSYDGLALDTLPLQRPYPPVWYAGGAETAGKRGFNFLGRSPTDVGRYWQLWQETRGSPDRVNAHLRVPATAMTRHLVVRESYAEAEAIVRRAWPVYESHFFATSVLVNRDGASAPLGRARSAVLEEALQNDRRFMLGTPDDLRRQITEWSRQLAGLPGLIFAPAVQWGDISHDEAMATLGLLAEVLPAVQRQIA